MKYYVQGLLAVLIWSIILNAQTKELKEKAIQIGKQGNYTGAIEILKEAVKDNPDDPEIYYYLGYYTHYLAYDSRPLIGYNIEYSDKVLGYFYKTIELDPSYGDAYYFIGAEYGARARNALMAGDVDSYKLAFKKSYDKNAFPPWLIEYGRNLLKSCEDNSILFVGGDAEINPVRYLQAIEKIREDVTVIPFALLNRPWFIEKLREGVDGVIKPVTISLTTEQIIDMHPYKWDTLIIEVPIREELKRKYKLLANEKLKWEVCPDYRTGSKSFLDAGRAVLMNIIESNKWERPVYFSLGCSPSFYSGLAECFQLNGITQKLLPFNTEGTEYEVNDGKIYEILFNEKNTKCFKSVDILNMPRVSGLLYNYYMVLYKLAKQFRKQNKFEKIDRLNEYIKKNLRVNTLSQAERIIKEIEQLGVE